MALFYFLYLLVNYKKENRKQKFVTTTGTITNVIWGHENGRYIVQANFKVNGFVLNTSALFAVVGMSGRQMCVSIPTTFSVFHNSLLVKDSTTAERRHSTVTARHEAVCINCA